MTTYFGFAIADGMFPPHCTVSRRALHIDEARRLVPEAAPCLNPSHAATIAAMRERFGIDVPIPEKPPLVTLDDGDSVIVMAVRGLPRLTDRHEHTDEEIAGADFHFGMWTVVSAAD